MKIGKAISAIIIIFSMHNSGFAQKKTMYSLDFNPKNYTTQSLTLNDKTLRVRAFEKIVYVQNPVDTTYEILNVYIPEEYFENKKVNGYTAATAPIFFPNQIGGYMPAQPASTQSRGMGGMAPLNGQPPMVNAPGGEIPPMGNRQQGGMQGGGAQMQSAVLVALSKGYVVASAGARGRTTKNATGIYTGKAPAAIVDLKAAIRYLKYNDQKMPGDANKIISNGTSAGGAMSALLGATGNNADYEPYLKALGAAPASDDIFAVSAYCPITNLDHADAAYEWQFNGVNDIQKRSFGPPGAPSNEQSPNTLSAGQIEVSAALKKLFPDYVNGLQLKDEKGKLLSLDADGNGSFKERVKSYVMASAQTTLNAGNDLSSFQWLTIKNKQVVAMDWDAYVRYMHRQKTPPAFDGLDLSTGENQEFGTEKIDKQHFTDYATTHSTTSATKADATIVKMMNPMYYVGTPETTTAKHWRIRHGTQDKDTGLAIPIILATYLQNNGFDVNLALPWEKPHSGDYDLDELFTWMDMTVKGK